MGETNYSVATTYNYWRVKHGVFLFVITISLWQPQGIEIWYDFILNYILFITRLIRRVPLVEQELHTLPGHMSSPLVFSGVRVTRSLILSVFLSFFVRPFCFLSFFDLWILITPFVSSNSSYKTSISKETSVAICFSMHTSFLETYIRYTQSQTIRKPNKFKIFLRIKKTKEPWEQYMTYLRNHFRANGQLGYKNSNSTLPHSPPPQKKTKKQRTKNKQKQNKNKAKTKTEAKTKQPSPRKTPGSFANFCCKTLYSLEFNSPASVIIPFYNVNDSTINIYVHTSVFISIGIQKYV